MLKSLACICAVVSCLAASEVRGQSYSVFHAFSGERGVPYAGLTQGPDGRLYGTTTGGGLFGRGSVYALTPDGSGGFTFTDLYSFSNGLDGGGPEAGLYLASDGNFYGATFTGGSANFGTLFKIDTAGNLETLHAFFGPDGAHPLSGLVQASDGNLYGAANEGGQNGYGNIFRLDLSGNFAVQHDFTGGSEGAFPVGSLIEGSPGVLYGTTSSGGAGGGLGTIYQMSTTGTFATLHNFSGPEGSTPQAGLVLNSDGYFYGTAQYGGGGTPGSGTVFRSDNSGNVTLVHAFVVNEGANPQAPLIIGNDRNFYGTTLTTAFQVTSSGALTVLHTFTGPDGMDLFAPLLQTSDGQLYGTAAIGGVGYGTVFRLTVSGSGFAILHTFSGAQASEPIGAFLQGADGYFYGTAEEGGPFGLGAIYRLDDQGNETDIHAFSGAAGAVPYGLVRTLDGTLFGTTLAGGSGNLGTIFKIDSTNTFSLVHQFVETEGSNPLGLTLSSDGTLYGALSNGTVDVYYGSLYHVDSLGTLTNIHTFAGNDGRAASGNFLELADGSFVGVTLAGGALDSGTIFKVDAAGNFTTLHSFSGWDGRTPVDPLVLGPDGNLYGVTAGGGGPGGYGVIYRLAPNGFFTVIHFFARDTDGAEPFTGPIIASDGNFYLTTTLGGQSDYGTVGRFDASGNVQTLHSFSFDDGMFPGTRLVQAVDGGFYGTLSSGGLLGGGVVFRVTAPPALSVWGITPYSGPAAGGTSVTITGANFNFGFGVSLLIGGVPATGISFISPSEIAGVTPALPAGTLNDVTVTDLNGVTGTLSKAWISDFLDVPQADIFHASVVKVFRDGISAGCGAGYYCRDSAVPREQIAVLLLRSEHGPSYIPSACKGVFADVPCPSQYADWIEQLAAEGITGGCGGGNYCPGSPVSRAQTAVFLLKAFHGSTYQPPACSGVFADVECTPNPAFAVNWIEEFYTEGVTGGCQPSPLLYCPDSPVSRGQMAVFLDKAFTLP